jgi:hypothetical protein|tara:strand:+ start:300 stop:515 length:216 start_codon:yes stop_codon:yes gene_type:complete
MKKFTFSDWAERIYGKQIHGPKKVVDKQWSLKDEYHLNKNNLIFKKDFPLKRILSDLSKENDKLKKKSLRE